ncbi:MAG TPA: hypothetical protein VLM38_19135 [Blastocatellia bacterium]|nr:hypothetical protein [Blastocatellia bacterium]
MQRKLLAKMNYLQQVISHRPAGLAIGEVTLDPNLLTQLERAVYVFG